MFNILRKISKAKNVLIEPKNSYFGQFLLSLALIFGLVILSLNKKIYFSIGCGNTLQTTFIPLPSTKIYHTGIPYNIVYSVNL